tara:strand:- start:50 stop:1552 length:1503 start_codon:yes stop_codon:yes gene_type:complete
MEIERAVQKIMSNFPGITRDQALRIYHARRGVTYGTSAPIPQPKPTRIPKMGRTPGAPKEVPIAPKRPVGMQEGGDSAFEARIAELMAQPTGIPGKPFRTREEAISDHQGALNAGYDFDGDGVVTATERTEGITTGRTTNEDTGLSSTAQIFALGPYEARIQELMARGMTRKMAEDNQRNAISYGWDINNDGAVSEVEKFKAIGAYVPGEMQARAEDNFNPAVEARIQELMARGMTRQMAEDNQTNALSLGYDLNGDGVVSAAEQEQAITNTAMSQEELDAAEAERLANLSAQNTEETTTTTTTTTTPETETTPGVTTTGTENTGIAELLALIQQLQAAQQQSQQTTTNPFSTQQGYNPYQQYQNLMMPQMPQFGQPYMSQTPFLPYAGMANPMSPSIFGGYGYGYGPSQTMAPLSYYGGFSAIPTRPSTPAGEAGAETQTGTTGTGTTAGAASGAQTNANAAQSYLANLFSANKGNQFGGSYPQMPQMPYNPSGVYMMP